MVDGRAIDGGTRGLAPSRGQIDHPRDPSAPGVTTKHSQGDLTSFKVLPYGGGCCSGVWGTGANAMELRRCGVVTVYNRR